jgi:N-acetylmuramoyl-L-alanine amidase
MGVAQGVLLLAPLVFPASAKLSTLAEEPEWRLLDKYQGTLTVTEFQERIPVFSSDGALNQYLTVSDGRVEIFSDKGKTAKLWELRLAAKPADGAGKSIRAPADRERPLTGLRICLDPGHIGGEWADMEERHFRIRGGPWVDEAALNFETCRWIERGLRAAGAEVLWVKRELGVPVTDRRPADFVPQAIKMMWRVDAKKASRSAANAQLKLLRWYEELIFYRVAEIQARAEIARDLQPDLTLCIHYNAFGWSKRGPKLHQNVNRIVIFTHGGYLASELEYDDMKFHLLQKLLAADSDTERRVAEAVARQVVNVWNYPPERPGESPLTVTATPLGKTPYVWSRNLLANRLYPGPVVFVEGPFMDDALTYQRIIAGDYDGERTIAGRKYRSLYREYAEIVVQGVIDAYRQPPP